MRKILSRSSRSLFILCLEVVATLAAIILLAWGGLLWRLDQGPVNLSMLRGPLQQTLNSNIDDYNIRFDDVQLGWGGLRTPLELQMTDVGVFDKDSDMMLAGVSQIGLELSKGALMTGEIAPSAINFYNIGLRVFYDEDQGISLSLDHNEKTDTDNNFLETLRRGAFEKKDGAQDVSSRLRFLQTIRIINADVLIQSDNFAEDVILRDTRIVMKKNDAQIAATLDGMMNIRENETPLLGHIYFNPDAKTNIASLHFSDLEITDVKSLISEEWRKRLTLEGVFKGTSHISFDTDFQPQNVRFEMNVKNGLFNFDNVFAQPVAFENLGMISSFDFETQDMSFENLRLENQELVAELSGTSSILEDGAANRIVLESRLENLPVNDIGLYWPQNVVPAARTWVSENIRSGVVTSASQKLDIIKRNDGAEIKALEGDIHFEKASVTYLSDFPAVENVSGTALFDPERFVINLDGGLYRQTQLTPSKITIDGFGGQSKIDIALNIQTTLEDALDILDHEPYKFTTRMQLPYMNMSGDAAVNLNFAFPLKKDLTDKEIKYDASASSFNFRWNDILEDMDLNDANIDLKIDGPMMNVAGNGQLAGQAVEFDYTKYFEESDLETKLTAKARVAPARFLPEALKQQISISGLTPVYIEQNEYADKRKTVKISANLQEAGFEIPSIKAVKPVGVPGKTDLILNYQAGRLQNLREIDFNTPALSFSGQVDMTVDSGQSDQWNNVIFPVVKYGDNDFGLKADRRADEIAMKVSGKRFDISSYLRGNDDQQSDTKQTYTPIRISGEMDQLITAQNEYIRNAKVFLERSAAGRIDRLELDGLAGNGQLYLRYRPADSAGYNLRIEADDAGATLKTLGYSKSIRGGVMVVDGRPSGQGTGRDMAGRFQISNFSMVEAPVLARLLNGMSVNGLSALLQGDGIDFARLSGNFKWQDKSARSKDGGLLTISEGKTSGASLGLTFGGTMDMADKTVDIQGNIVPVSNINTAFSDIPVLGDLLTGGGDGVFAATYSVKGPIKTPTTTVNPLAALAPGILRDIFFEQDSPAN